MVYHAFTSNKQTFRMKNSMIFVFENFLMYLVPETDDLWRHGFNQKLFLTFYFRENIANMAKISAFLDCFRPFSAQPKIDVPNLYVN